MAIHIITDSTCDLTREEADELGVTVLPILVHIAGKDYRDRVDLSADEFYEKMIEEEELPKTSQITPYAYEEAIQEQIQKGNEVILITCGSTFSGCYHNAYMVAQDYPETVTVIDSDCASFCLQILVRYACELIKRGLSLHEITGILEEEKKYIHIICLVDTLDYACKGGRVSPLVAAAGKMLGIHPVITVWKRKIEVVGKARGSRSGNNLLIKEIVDSGGIRFDMPFCLGYSGLSDRKLKKYIEDSAPLYEGKTDEGFHICQFGSSIGTYSGPGAVGCAWFAKKPNR